MPSAPSSLPRQVDSKRRPLPKLRMLDKNLSLVIVFDNPAGKAQAQAPSTGLGCKAWLKNHLDLGGRNSLAGIRNINLYMVLMRMDGPCDGACTFFKGIQGVAHDI